MLASGLKSNRTHTLALVLTDITNPFWTTVARAVEDEASSHGYTVLFCNTDESEAKQEQYLSMLLRRRVDGVLLVPASNSGATVRKLQEKGVRIVVLDRQVEGVEVDIVRGDSYQGARGLTDHLLGLGHRRIGMLAGPAAISVSGERVAGYRAALAAAGVPPDSALIRYGGFTVDGGDAMAQALLQLDPRPTAFFAANNFIAIGALRALHNVGLSVPQDISLVAFDDLPDTYIQPPFLTVRGPANLCTGDDRGPAYAGRAGRRSCPAAGRDAPAHGTHHPRVDAGDGRHDLSRSYSDPKSARLFTYAARNRAYCSA